MEYQLNPVEAVLEIYGERGLSIRQLKEITDLPKRKIKSFIYNSMFIEDTPPLIHGSCKAKIRVFNYTPNVKQYFTRRITKRVKVEDVTP